MVASSLIRLLIDVLILIVGISFFMDFIIDSIRTISSKNLLFVVDGNRNRIYNSSFEGKENVYKKDFIDILKEKSLKFINLDTIFSNN